MKNLLLIFILANVLYFLWSGYTEKAPQPGVAVIEDSDLGPPLQVTTDDVASVGAVLGAGETEAMEAVIGRACVTIGPFSVTEDADTAMLENRGEGMQMAMRSEEGPIFIGHSVSVPNLQSLESGRPMLPKLAEVGLDEAFIVGNDQEGFYISLGIFGNEENVEKVKEQARSAGFETETSQMTRDGVQYFVDIGLPPGKGAGEIVEKYGEDRVALRNKATCPE